MLSWRTDVDGTAGTTGVLMAFSDRQGGVSSAPYDALNLGNHVGDESAAVAENRHRLAAAVGVAPGDLVFMRQVHGPGVAVVDRAPGPGDEPPAVDALVTATPGLALVVLVADCSPVLLADAAQGVVGAAHAGRQGMAAGVVDAVVDTMVGLGARPERLVARVGPAVCGYCYEVPQQLQDEVAARVPESRAVTRRAGPAIDVVGGVLAQLGRRCADVAWVGPCTVESRDHFSYRRDRTTGRSAGVVRAAAR